MSSRTTSPSAPARAATVTANRSGRTNAVGIEEDFVAEIERRFRDLRGAVRSTVGYQNDALALSSNVEARERFDFPTSAGKRRAFVEWLDRAILDDVLEPLTPEEVREGNHWTAAFIRASYRAGVDQASGLLMQEGVRVEGFDDADILERPIFTRSLERLYTRTYENLKTVTEDAAPTVRRRLTEGFAKGWNPRKTARALTDELEDLQRSRAETLARSETINAHSTATLDNYERMGVSVVSHGEWQMTLDDDTCAFCRRLSGAELTIEEMRTGATQWRGSIYRLQPPAHPNGRCVILPSIGGTPPTSALVERVPGTPIDGSEVAGANAVLV